MRLEPINLYDYEARAQQVLPHNVWDFIDAGAMDETTTRRNRTAFEDLTLRPRFLRDIRERRISTTVLGEEISLPVMIAPAGSHALAHPDGELATARGAGMANTLMLLSTSSNYSLEEVAEAASGPLWFQLYHRGYDLTEMLVRRAEAAGYKAICLTVDTPVYSGSSRLTEPMGCMACWNCCEKRLTGVWPTAVRPIFVNWSPLWSTFPMDGVLGERRRSRWSSGVAPCCSFLPFSRTLLRTPFPGASKHSAVTCERSGMRRRNEMPRLRAGCSIG